MILYITTLKSLYGRDMQFHMPLLGHSIATWFAMARYLVELMVLKTR